MRPLARHLGAKWVIANRLEFRDGIATGRLLDPVIRPRGAFARITGAGPDGRRVAEQLVRDLGFRSVQSSAVGGRSRSRQIPIARSVPSSTSTAAAASRPLSVRKALARQAHHADRRDRIHRQSLAGEYL